MVVKLQYKDQSYVVDHITTNFITKRTGQINRRHRHPVFHLMYITEGRGVFLINDTFYEAEPGMLFVISPNEWHQFSAADGEMFSDLECTFMLKDAEHVPAEVSFYDYVEERWGILLSQLDRHAPLKIPPSLQPVLMEGFQRIIEAPASFFTKQHLGVLVMDLWMRVESILMQLSGNIRVESNSAESTVYQVKQYMKAHLSQSISLADIAAFVHLTPNYLCNVFKKETGDSLMNYLHKQRMLEAQKLLAHTDLPIYIIAEKVGFEDASYFARSFRKLVGQAPQQYRGQFIVGVCPPE